MPVTEASKLEQSSSLFGEYAGIFAVVLAVKLLFLFLDPTPSFRFDDSGAYLATAIVHYIPLDRSFLYGMLLLPAVRIQNLQPIVVVQVLLSALSASAVGFAALRYFGTSRASAGLLSLLCALEPLQLSMERFIMTETLATFLLASLLCAGFEYFRTSRLPWLAVAECAGVALIAIRVSYLPLLLASTVMFPLLCHWRKQGFHLSNYRPALAAFVFSILFSQSLLWGYRHVYGHLAHQPAGYNYRQGEFLLADLSPLVRPADFPDRAQGDAIFSRLKYPVTDPEMRSVQRWMDGGLIESLKAVVADENRADAVGRKAAEHAVVRDPGAALHLFAITYRQFFEPATYRQRLRYEEDQINPPTPGTEAALARVFGIDTHHLPPPSLTKRYADALPQWSAVVVAFPLVYLLLLAVRIRRVQPEHLVLLVSSLLIVAGAITVTEAANPRYITGLAWLTFAMAASLFPLFRRGGQRG